MSVQRRQVVDLPAPPPPVVTEYRVHTVICPDCRLRVAGPVPAHASGRVSYGPGVLAAAAEIGCGHCVPVARGARLLGTLTGIQVSSGFMAGVRARAARLVEKRFLPTAFGLLAQADVVHVDEMPARADKKLAYEHTKANEQVAVLHTGTGPRPRSTPTAC